MDDERGSRASRGEPLALGRREQRRPRRAATPRPAARARRRPRDAARRSSRARAPRRRARARAPRRRGGPQPAGAARRRSPPGCRAACRAAPRRAPAARAGSDAARLARVRRADPSPDRLGPALEHARAEVEAHEIGDGAVVEPHRPLGRRRVEEVGEAALEPREPMQAQRLAQAHASDARDLEPLPGGRRGLDAAGPRVRQRDGAERKQTRPEPGRRDQPEQAPFARAHQEGRAHRGGSRPARTRPRDRPRGSRARAASRRSRAARSAAAAETPARPPPTTSTCGALNASSSSAAEGACCSRAGSLRRMNRAAPAAVVPAPRSGGSARGVRYRGAPWARTRT